MTVRRWVRRTGIAFLSLIVLGAIAYWTLFIPTIYFRVALFMIERNSMMRERVDWPTVRAETDELLRDARSTRDTYPAIRLVLRRLGDNHSHLVPPETVRAIQHGANLTLGLTAIWPEPPETRMYLECLTSRVKLSSSLFPGVALPSRKLQLGEPLEGQALELLLPLQAGHRERSPREWRWAGSVTPWRQASTRLVSPKSAPMPPH